VTVKPIIPSRLIHILPSGEADESSRLPSTVFFNEGWMLRLVLDGMQTLGVRSNPLAFTKEAET
jgi:hypothetical protein